MFGGIITLKKAKVALYCAGLTSTLMGQKFASHQAEEPPHKQPVELCAPVPLYCLAMLCRACGI
jgi:hypothetical protein